MRECINLAINICRSQTCMIVTSICAKEAVDKELRVTGWKRVLCPKQEIVIFSCHNCIQLVPTVTRSHHCVHHNAKGFERPLDHRLQRHQGCTLSIGDCFDSK